MSESGNKVKMDFVESFDHKKNTRLITLMVWILVYASLVHLGLFFYDLMNPDVFINADRAKVRLSMADQLLPNLNSFSDFLNFIGNHGLVGDYLPQALLYLSIGQYGLILFQILLFVVSLGYLFKLTFLLTKSGLIACTTVLVYMHLPHAIVFPHQLLTEALYIPLIIISFYLVINYIFHEQSKFSNLAISAILIGIATLIRPVTVLWPFAIIGIVVLVMSHRISIKPWGAYLAITLAPLILWMSFIYVNTGNFSMGESGYSMPRNLHLRVEHMINTMDQNKQQSMKKKYLDNNTGSKKTMTLSEYINFINDYPGVFIVYSTRDTLAFWLKSGINRLIVDYLQIIDDIHTHKRTNLRRYWEAHGFQATVQHIYKESSEGGKFIIINGLGIIIFSVYLFLSATGIIAILLRFYKFSISERAAFIAITIFPFYIFLASHAAGTVQSRHRFPAEFALTILMVFGFSWLNQMYSKKRLSIKK